MKIKILIFSLCLSLIHLYSCNSSNQANKIGDVLINMKHPFAMVHNSIDCNDGNSVLVLQSLEDMNLHFYEFNSKNIISSYIVNSKVINSLPFFQLFVKDIDSIVFFDPKTNCISIVDSAGVVSFEKKLKRGAPALNPDNRLNCIGEKLYLGNSNRSLNVSIPNERKKYYQIVKPIFETDIQDSTNHEKQWGYFPRDYVVNNYDYCNYFSNVCSYSSESVLVSFPSDDSIYLYKNGHKIRGILCASQFIKKIKPYPEKERLNMAFYKDYLFAEPKYIDLIYNNYTQQYLRVVKHRFNYKSDNKFDTEHMRWSIIIMNSKLKVINEFVFDYRRNSPEVILCTFDGVYISDVPNSLENMNHLSLSLYNF
jgi:hypothetical protein